MELERGRVVRSKAGRDKGKFLAAAGMSGGMVLVCDGRERPLEKPKRKNPKHLIPTSETLTPRNMAGNRSLKKALATFGKEPERTENAAHSVGRECPEHKQREE